MRTRALLRLAPALLSLALPLACGPEAPPPKVADTKPVASTSARPVEAVLTPVDAPAGLAVAAQAKSMRGFVERATALVPEWSDLGTSRVLAEVIGSDAIAALVDADKAVDFALALHAPSKDPNVYDDGYEPAYSLAIRDDADFGVLLGKYKLVAGANGVQYLAPESPKVRGANCAVAPALGPTKQRLVCAIQPERVHLDALLPWLTRGAPTRTFPEDLHVDVNAAPIKQAFAARVAEQKELLGSAVAAGIRVGLPKVDKLLGKTGNELFAAVTGVYDDLDRASVGLTFGASGPTVTLDASFGKQTAGLTKLLLAGADVTTPVPALFGKLPIERAGMLGFARAGAQSEALMESVRGFADALVGAAAEDLKWSKGDAEAARSTLKLLLAKPTDAFFAYGRGDAKPVAKPPRVVVPKLGKPPVVEAPASSWVDDLREGLARPTWSITAHERPIDQSVSLSKSFAALLAKPGVAAAVRFFTEDRVELKATTKTWGAKELKDLPKGSFGQTYDLTLTVYEVAKKKRGKETAKLHFTTEELQVPEGANVFTAAGSNLAAGELQRRVLDAIAGKGATVSTLPGFAALTAGTPAWGLVVRVGDLARQLTAQSAHGHVEGLLGKLPDKGEVPLTIRSSATRAGDGGKVQLAIALPRDVIAAYLALLPQH